MTAYILDSLSDVEYHADPAISASHAKLCLESMQLYKDVLDGVVPHKDSPALEVGKIAHMAVLEPERFAAQVRSEGPINAKTGKPFGRDTNAFKEWQQANPDVMMVDPWLPISIARMPAKVRDIFASGLNEQSVFADLPALGLRVKCRPDSRHVTERRVYDLKSIDSIHKCERAIEALSYWFSAGWYRMVLRELFGHSFGYSFIFMEKAPPYRWRIYRMSDGYLDLADEEVDKVLGDLSTAYRTGCWDDADDLDHVADPPQRLNPDDFTVSEEGISL
jgi:hypothetical protein